MVAHCCIVGCCVDSSRCRGVSFHNIYRKKYKTWSNELISSINRTDGAFKPENAMICSRHFTPDCLSGFGRKRKLRPGSLPTRFLTIFSVTKESDKDKKPAGVVSPNIADPEVEEIKIEKPEPAEPSDVELSDTDANDIKPMVTQETFGDVKEEVDICNSYHHSYNKKPKPLQTILSELTIPQGWHPIMQPSHLDIIKYNVSNLKIEKCLRLQNDYVINVFFYGMKIFVSAVYTTSKNLSDLLSQIEKRSSCNGLTSPDLISCALNISETYYKVTYLDNATMTMVSTLRSRACTGIGPVCLSCRSMSKIFKLRLVRRKAAEKRTVIGKHAPLCHIPEENLASALKESRRKNKQMKRIIESFRLRLIAQRKKQPEPEPVEPRPLTSKERFFRLFWAQQKKNIDRTKSACRWHPMMIRFALFLYSESPHVYRSLKETGALKLPGVSTLKAQRKNIAPSPGFKEMINTGSW